MKWLEVNPIPGECKECHEGDCYNCDIAGKRWVLSQEDKLRTDRILKIKAIQRLQRQVEQIDQQLRELAEKQ